MTGYGRADVRIDDIPYAIELKSLNSKFFDLQVRVPSRLRGREMELRKWLESLLHRGKVQLYITPQGPEAVSAKALNKNLLRHYVDQVRETFPQADLNEMLNALLRHPDIWYSAEEDNENTFYQALLPALQQAVEQLQEFRKNEGKSIEKDLKKHLRVLRTKLDKIREAVPDRNKKWKDKLLKTLEENYIEIDQDRFEQELIYYLEKGDINEEIQRLDNHLRYFSEVLRQKNPITKGKKLNFIAQEIGREINTIGSKANDSNIQKMVVEMKEALEKIKEQTANIL